MGSLSHGQELKVFDEKDTEQIRKKGISLETVRRQAENFSQNFPPMRIVKPAIPGDGIRVFSPQESEQKIREFDSLQSSKTLLKFIPASGAATRMFKDLFEYGQNARTRGEETGNPPLSESLRLFFSNISEFAFYDELARTLEGKGRDIRTLINKKNFREIVSCLLGSGGMNYGSLPKGLLKFHGYSTGPRTPVEEHLVEGAEYARNADDTVEIHLTVSPEHRNAFELHVSDVKARYEKDLG